MPPVLVIASRKEVLFQWIVGQLTFGSVVVESVKVFLLVENQIFACAEAAKRRRATPGDNFMLVEVFVRVKVKYCSEILKRLSTREPCASETW